MKQESLSVERNSTGLPGVADSCGHAEFIADYVTAPGSSRAGHVARQGVV